MEKINSTYVRTYVMRSARGERSVTNWLNIKPKNYNFDCIYSSFGLTSSQRGTTSAKMRLIPRAKMKMKMMMMELGEYTPLEDLELDGWLCTREPANMYILCFQEVVPLNAGNVLGAEDGRPIAKWEDIISKIRTLKLLTSPPLRRTNNNFM